MVSRSTKDDYIRLEDRLKTSVFRNILAVDLRMLLFEA
jgi:hypothetical protein